MKDSMTHLFRDRFQGHEAPVDPATWQVIEARLIAAGPAADPVNDLFRERFQGHESPVGPQVWNGIGAQLGHPVAGGGFGWMAAGVAGVVAIGALVFALQSGPDNKPELAQAMTVAVEPAPTVEEAAVPNTTSSTAIPGAVGVASTVAQARTSVGVANPAAPAEVETELSAPGPDAIDAGTQLIQADPEKVEQIIQTITEQVKQEVAEETRRMPQAEPGSGVFVTEDPIGAPARDEDGPKLLLPNTFTPNNDGINDRYEVSMVGFSSLMMRVYSIKTNQLVFATDSSEPWTGANCEDGMYLVAVEAMTTEGRMVAEGKVVYLNRTSTN